MRGILVVMLGLACNASSPPAPAPDPKPPVPAPTAHPASPAGIDVRVDRRVELISIVQRLAGAGREYLRAPPTPYVAAVDAAFAPFRAHPVIEATRVLRATHGISWDAPMILAVHLDDDLQLRNAAEMPSLDARWDGVDLEAYAAALRDFAAVARLDAFLAAHQAHFSSVATRLRTVVAAEDPVGWFDALFGARAKARYRVVPALLTGPANFGVRATLPEGTEELYQILGVDTADGLPRTDELTVWLLVHEMAHAYVNPLLAQHEAALARSGAALFALVEQPMRAQAYPTWQIMLNEAVVRAVTVLYLRDRKGEAAATAAIDAERGRGFRWTAELAARLERYRADRTRYPDLAAFMPELIAQLDALARQHAPPR